LINDYWNLRIEAHLMLFVTSENINTGDIKNELTKKEIERI
jgi:hypothetical protein